MSKKHEREHKPEKQLYHKQFTGSGWRIFPVKQENLKCSTLDCSECEDVTREIEAKEAAQAAHQTEKEAERLKLENESAEAKRRVEETEQIRAEAGVLRSQATNKANNDRLKIMKEAEETYRSTAQELESSYKSELEKAEKTKEKVIGEAILDCNSTLKDIAETDWLAKAKDSLGL